MIECYFSECIYHDKDEPFCTMSECQASLEEVESFKKIVWINHDPKDNTNRSNSGSCTG
jgi:hypothetical protein